MDDLYSLLFAKYSEALPHATTQEINKIISISCEAFGDILEALKKPLNY